MPEKKDHISQEEKKNTATGGVKEDTENKAPLKKNSYPLPGMKDTQYDYQPEFIENSGNKQEEDKAK